MTEQIDLTDDGNEATAYVAKSNDEGNKKRVVALAEGLNERLRVAEAPPRKRVRTAVDGVEFPAPVASGEMLQGRGAPVAAAAKSPVLPAAVPAPVVPQAAAAQRSNNLLAQLHAERLARMSDVRKAELRSPGKLEKPSSSGQSQAADADLQLNRAAAPSTRQQQTSGQLSTSASARSVSLLSYNLWFNEEVALVGRMRAVGETIEREGYPDLLLFQEVTQNIVLLFRQATWFRRYHCSPVADDKSYFTLLLARRDTVALPAMQQWVEKDYGNSCMGRTILYTRVTIGGRPLVVGTTHLESPVGPGPQQMVSQRKEQLAIAVRELEAAAGTSGDVLLAGDLNWSDARDGTVRMPVRWCDAWQSLMPNHAGLTWDPVSNPMLTSRYKGSRLDRVLCRLSSGGPSAAAAGTSGGRGGVGGWQLGGIKLVGTQALPGMSYEHRGKRLPVLPSDHFGLLVKLLPAEVAPANTAAGHVLGSAASAPSPARAQPDADPMPARASTAANGNGAGGRDAVAVAASVESGARTTGRSRQQQRAGAPAAAREAAVRSRQPVTEVDLSAEDADDEVIVL